MGNCIIARRGGASSLKLRGNGTSASPYLINSLNDWLIFRNLVNQGITDSSFYYQLNNDINIGTNSIGNNTYSFSGHFNGNGHTITVNKTGTSQTMDSALFLQTRNATISNLRIAGTISLSPNEQCGVFVGHIINTTTTLTIENCECAASIINTGSYCGGFTGNTESGGTTINNCLFSGSVSAGNSFAAFCGWLNGTITITNCLEAATAASSNQYCPIGNYYSGKSNPYSLTNNIYTNATRGSAPYVAAADLTS